MTPNIESAVSQPSYSKGEVVPDVRVPTVIEDVLHDQGYVYFARYLFKMLLELINATDIYNCKNVSPVILLNQWCVSLLSEETLYFNMLFLAVIWQLDFYLNFDYYFYEK